MTPRTDATGVRCTTSQLDQLSSIWFLDNWTTATTTLFNNQQPYSCKHDLLKFRVRAKTATETGDWSAITTFKVLGDSAPVLTQVVGVSASPGASNTQLSVSFMTQAQATSYDIEYEIRSGSSVISTATTTATSSPATINALGANTIYHIRVRAKNATETGAWSTAVTAQTSAPSVSLVQVSNVSVSATSGTQLLVSWSTQSQATGYDIQHRLTSSAPSGSWTATTSTSSPATITSLTANTSYQVRVRAKTATETGDWSSVVQVTTLASSVVALPQASAPTLSSITQTTITVSWTNVSNATNYDIRHKPMASSVWTTLTNQSSPTTISNLTADTVYEVQVRGTAPQNSQVVPGPWSSSAQDRTVRPPSNFIPPPPPPFTTNPVIPQPQPIPPTQVTNVVVSQTAESTELSVSFDTQVQAAGYDIEHRLTSSAPSGAWTATTSTTSPTTITGLTASTSYQVRVRAKTQTQMGAWSSTITQTTANAPAPPVSPTLTQVTNVSATSTMSSTELMISWDTQDDATSYDVEYRLSSTAPSGAWTMDTATTSPAVVMSLTASTSYQIRVRAKTQTQTGDWSATVTQSTADAPVSPPTTTLTQVTNVVVSQTTENTELSVAFNTQTTATSYDVEYRLSSTAPSGLWSMSTTTSTPHTLTSLTTGSSYQVRVRATTQTETGDWSDTQTQSTPVPPMTLSQVTGVAVSMGSNDAELSVAFMLQTQATNYDIEHRLTSSAPSGAWTRINTSMTPTTITGLTANTSYQIRVRAKNLTQTGDWSATATQSTSVTLVQVTGVTATQEMTDQTQARISFDTQTSVTQYDIQYAEITGLATVSAPPWTTATATTSPATVTTVTPGRTYWVRVRARSGTMTGAWSSTIPYSSPLALGQVSQIATSQESNTSVFVSFPATQHAQNYEMQYKKSTDTAWTVGPSSFSNSGVTLMGLDAETQYDIQVRGTSVIARWVPTSSGFSNFINGMTRGFSTAYGPWSDTVNATTTFTIAQTSGISAQLLEAGRRYPETRLSWNAVPLATRYTIQSCNTVCNAADSETDTDWTTTTSTSTTADITLSVGIENSVRIRAQGINQQGSVVSGDWSDIFTYTPAVNLPTPNQIMAMTLSDSSIRVYWSVPELADIVDIYDIRYQYTNRDTIVSNIGSVFTSPGTVSGLFPTTEYTIDVRAGRQIPGTSTYTYGDWSTTTTATTLPSIGAPVNPAVTFYTETRAEISWNYDAGVRQYDLRLTPHTTNVPSVMRISSVSNYGNRSSEAINIQPNTTYTYEVRGRATLSDGRTTYGYWSTPVQGPGFLPKMPLYIRSGPPHEIPSQVNVWWSAVPGADYYEIRYRQRGISAQWTEVRRIAALNFTITGLMPSTEYAVQVRAFVNQSPRTFNNMFGYWSDSATITTGDPPPVPPNFLLTIQRGNISELEFQFSSIPGVTGYDIEICDTTLNDCSDNAHWQLLPIFNDPADAPSDTRHTSLLEFFGYTAGTIRRLDQGTRYGIRARAFYRNSRGTVNGQWTTPAFATTDFTASPDPARNLNANLQLVGSVLDSRLRLTASWDAPVVRAGVPQPREYEVQYESIPVLETSPSWSSTTVTTNTTFTADFGLFINVSRVRVRSRAQNLTESYTYSPWVEVPINGP